MRTGIWQLLPKEADGAQHQSYFICSLQPLVRQFQDRPYTDALGRLVDILVGLSDVFHLPQLTVTCGEYQVPATTKRNHGATPFRWYRIARLGGGTILGFRTNLNVQIGTMTGQIYQDVILEQHARLFRVPCRKICVYRRQRPSSPCKHRERMPSIGRYHLYGLARILTVLEFSSACVTHAWPTSGSPSTISYISTGISESVD
ncbi:nibrin [Trichonephila clavipes]|nr:nibrin [Trichonephila clavipes]